MRKRAAEAKNVTIEADVVLVGGGIMSATLGSMLSLLEPDWRIVVLERQGTLATESSGPWNNAGTGHSGFCELNYMPDPADGSKAANIAKQFLVSRQWWSHLTDEGLLPSTDYITETPHMDLVFGERDVTYLRERYQTLSKDPLFEGLEYSEDHATIAQWAPLMMAGRDPNELVAATRQGRGTDVDFGALTRALTEVITARGGSLLTGHTVRDVKRGTDGRWSVSGTTQQGDRFTVTAGHAFMGAGGMALRLLQKSKIPEIRGYAVLPVGAGFYRCSNPEIVAQHEAKVYGQAGIGAPPMSVPHLDRRHVGGTSHLMFGPYATFGTKLLKNGSLTDFFTTITWRNLPVVTAASLQNFSLGKYAVKELLAGPKRKFRELQRYYPQASTDDWELILAGQRAQVVQPHPKKIGELQFGTELIAAQDGTMSGLLGASPGASTAVPIMLDLLEKCFPQRWTDNWHARFVRVMPDVDRTDWDTDSVQRVSASTSESLDLDEPAVQGDPVQIA